MGCLFGPGFDSRQLHRKSSAVLRFCSSAVLHRGPVGLTKGCWGGPFGGTILPPFLSPYSLLPTHLSFLPTAHPYGILSSHLSYLISHLSYLISHFSFLISSLISHLISHFSFLISFLFSLFYRQLIPTGSSLLISHHPLTPSP
jgi:phosphotransferase system  glucose/maltose/N-acetylglucosamine-specific IIC component